MKAKKSGHTEALRAILTDAREKQKLSRQDVANLMVAEINRRAEAGLGERIERLAGETVRQYEEMLINPPIDKFAVWARVLGFRLIVDLDQDAHGRMPVLVASEEAQDVAHAVDAMDEASRRAFRRLSLDADARDLVRTLMSVPRSRRRALLDLLTQREDSAGDAE